MKKFIDSIRYDWNMKAALVHSCCIAVLVVCLCIPISSIMIFIRSLVFSDVPMDVIKTTGHVLVVYLILTNLIRWQYANIFNWIMTRIYQRTKWDGMVE